MLDIKSKHTLPLLDLQIEKISSDADMALFQRQDEMLDVISHYQ